MPNILTLILAALAAASISFTITTTSVFKWLREMISPIHPKVEEWVHCPWCLNHWVLVGMMLFLNLSYFPMTGNASLDIVIHFFAMTAISGLAHYVLLRAYEPVAKLVAARQIEKLKRTK